MKTGELHLQSLRDGREVYIRGSRVADVTAHPAFRNSVASAAHLYDFQNQPENIERMTFKPPGAQGRVSRAWQLPFTYEDLVMRRQALTAWAETHFGFMGRSPDHVASCISGMFMGIEQFEAHSPDRAEALRNYYSFARDNDLFLTYVIINPQADRSRNVHEQTDEFLAARLCDQDSYGITVKGCKMLGTSSIMANEVLVTSIQPLAPGDEPYAISFAIPINAKGLRILSRKSYEWSAGSVYDYPLASRYDENDAVFVFDEVRVPWSRVFVAGDVGMCQKQFHATPAHVYQNYQCQIRLAVKLRFLAGVASRIAEANGIASFPQVRETLGELAAHAAMVDAFVHAMEVKGRLWGSYYLPDRHTLYAAQALTQEMYPRFIHKLRELAGGSMIMLPSGIEDFADPEIAGYVLRAQGSATMAPEERVKFFKLAWDAAGSEFASRHTQYEMFYAGASFVTKGHSLRTYDWDAATALVDNLLSSYDRETELRRKSSAAGPHE
ncbi:MAG: 4-hydroxyphenylacetate 3-hydroxylase N-terminal domain-containing protein [Bryobacteraceae bacterium]